jgi:hypothetical protein
MTFNSRLVNAAILHRLLRITLPLKFSLLIRKRGGT